MTKGVLFSNEDCQNGVELWISDRTDAGTRLLKDLYPGPRDGVPSGFAVLGDAALFGAETIAAPRELWITDGTAAGTLRVADINPGSAGSSIDNLTAVGGVVRFTATDGVNGVQLWETDGTAAGTVAIADFDRPENGGSNPSGFIELDGVLYFSADDGVHGRELWRSDGSEAGTVLVRDLNGSPTSSQAGALARLGDRLVLGVNDGMIGQELWLSDGTGPGTQPLADINPGSASSTPGLVAADGARIFFTADDGAHGRELWVSDGTAAGTALVADVNPGTASSFASRGLLWNDRLYWPASDGVHGVELWGSDGTPGGTAMVRDIYAGANNSIPGDLVDLGPLAFLFRTGGSELWRSDGTAAGTVRVGDGTTFGAIGLGSLRRVGDLAWLTAGDASAGREPFRTDGTATGTTLVFDVNPGPASSGIYETVVEGGRVFFANSLVGSNDLWVSDLTGEGTALIGANVIPTELAAVPGAVVLSAVDPAGAEPWWSDGSAERTVPIADVAVGQRSSSPHSFVRAGGFLFFVADDNERGAELWAIAETALPLPCPPQPRGDCRAGAASRLSLVEGGAAAKLSWKWTRGEATPLAAFGDPRAETDYTLCLYGDAALILALQIPAGGTCAGASPCWKTVGAIPRGFAYSDRDAGSDGVRTMTLTTGGSGVAKLQLRAQGEALRLPGLPPALPVQAQLVNRDGACWSATYASGGGNAGRFAAKQRRP